MLSRRDALKGTIAPIAIAAMGAGAAYAVATIEMNANDARLMGWGAEIIERERSMEDAITVLTDEEVRAAFKPIVDLEHRIAETEADTWHGLAVKVRRLIKDLEDGDGAWSENNFRTTLASLERLTGEV